jgi:hypothetical protein
MRCILPIFLSASWLYFGHFFLICVLDQLKCGRLDVVKIKEKKRKTGCNSAIHVFISWFIDEHVQSCPPLGIRTEDRNSYKVKGQHGILRDQNSKKTIN